MPIKRGKSLEYRLFLMACVISMSVSFLITLLDTFIAKEYDSSAVGIISFFTFAFFFYQVKYKQRFEALLTPYIVSLMVIINLAWFTGGGLNLSNAFIYLMILILIIIISPTRTRSIFLAFVFVNLTVFTVAEFMYPNYGDQIMNHNRLLVINTVVLFLVFSITTYIITFFKNQYDLEHSTVNEQNRRLDASNTEIEAQNEELLQYQEEVMAQRDFIEEKNKKLEIQAVELEKANQQIQEINLSLEKTVNERTKKLMDLNNDLDLLVYRISHDFRRPLTTLMGLNEVARLTIKDEVSQELFRKVNNTALGMDKMLLKFFMLYNINHFRTTFEGDTLTEIVGRIEKDLILRKDNITFTKKIELNAYDEKDERNVLIEVILENLIENSLIYNRKDQMELDLEIAEKDGLIKICQKDNGNGIPLSYFGKIFEMYFRGSTLSTGNGLGLYVVRRAANLLDATIDVDSKEGEYTVFTLEFKV
ncbi:MAG: ATP-binding protein [Cytophagales bacterium]|nr:ATP-binding protein [Cytophagales bacterium]